MGLSFEPQLASSHSGFGGGRSSAKYGVNFGIFKNHSAAPEGVEYQPTGPKFSYVMECRPLLNSA